MKTCSKCGETKPLTGFSKKASKDGLQSRCKTCEAATNAARTAANRERRAVTKAAWRAANREKVAVYRAAWQKANPEKVAASWARRQARKRNAAGIFTSEQWLARLAYHENKCVYCGSREGLQIEHQIPLARGGTNWPANLVPACQSCNCSKGTKTPKEFTPTLNPVRPCVQ